MEVLAVLKRAGPDLRKLHQPLSPLPVAESCLICAPANSQQHDVGGGGGWVTLVRATRWQVNCLGGTHWYREVYYRYLQRSPAGRSELICKAALWKYNYRAKIKKRMNSCSFSSLVSSGYSSSEKIALYAKVSTVCVSTQFHYVYIFFLLHRLYQLQYVIFIESAFIFLFYYEILKHTAFLPSNKHMFIQQIPSKIFSNLRYLYFYSTFLMFESVLFHIYCK